MKITFWAAFWIMLGVTGVVIGTYRLIHGDATGWLQLVTAGWIVYSECHKYMESRQIH
jgi:hypothetical protein